MGELTKGNKNKIYWITFITIILGMVIWLTNQMNLRFSIGNERFRYIEKQVDNCEKYIFKDNEDHILTVDIKEIRYGDWFLLGKYNIYYLDKTIIIESLDGFNNGRKITSSDGTIYTEDIVDLLRGSGYKEYKPYDIKLVHGIDEVIKFKKNIGDSIIVFFLSLIIIAIGLIGIIYPEQLWKFEHCLKVSGGEPTEFAINSSKFGGILMILLALLFYPMYIG